VCPEWTSYQFQSPKLSRTFLFSKRRSEVLSKRMASSRVQVPVMPTLSRAIFRSKVYHLIQLGGGQGLAYSWSRTREGGWAIAQSPILGTIITLKVLKRRGYELSARLLLGNHPYFMNRRIRGPYVRWCERAEAAETSVASLYSIGGWRFYSISFFKPSITIIQLLFECFALSSS
jgi:hypothetical protein